MAALLQVFNTNDIFKQHHQDNYAPVRVYNVSTGTSVLLDVKEYCKRNRRPLPMEKELQHLDSYISSYGKSTVT